MRTRLSVAAAATTITAAISAPATTRAGTITATTLVLNQEPCRKQGRTRYRVGGITAFPSEPPDDSKTTLAAAGTHWIARIEIAPPSPRPAALTQHRRASAKNADQKHSTHDGGRSIPTQMPRPQEAPPRLPAEIPAEPSHDDQPDNKEAQGVGAIEKTHIPLAQCHRRMHPSAKTRKQKPPPVSRRGLRRSG